MNGSPTRFVDSHTKHFMDSLHNWTGLLQPYLLTYQALHGLTPRYIVSFFTLHGARFVFMEPVNFLCHEDERSLETEASQLLVQGPETKCLQPFAWTVTLPHLSACLKTSVEMIIDQPLNHVDNTCSYVTVKHPCIGITVLRSYINDLCIINIVIIIFKHRLGIVGVCR